MPRPKKDGLYINYYIDKKLVEKLRDYAEEKGQTMTMALERILQDYFATIEQGANNAKK